MTNRTLLILTIILLSILQTSFLYEIFGNKLNPNLVWALCFYLLLKADKTSAYIAALVGGLFLDMITDATIGVSSVYLTFFVWVYSQISSFYLRNNKTAVFFVSVCLYLFRLASARTFVFDWAVFFGSLMSALLGYTAWIIFKK